MRWELQKKPFPRGALLFAHESSLASPWQGLAAGLVSLQPNVFWRKSPSLPFGFKSGNLPAFSLPARVSVPLAWPHTWKTGKPVTPIARRRSSRSGGPDSLSRAQRKPQIYAELIDKTWRKQTYFEKQAHLAV